MINFIALSMKRRTVIKRSLVIGAGFVFAYTGIRTYNLFRKPALESLHSWLPLIDSVSETIIPQTESPGAKDAGVGKFVIKMVTDCADRPSQNKFVLGLSDLADAAHAHYKKPFFECSEGERISLLTDVEAGEHKWPGMLGKLERHYTGDSFFTTIKKYTVIGFCTSALGATRALAYDYIPGQFTGVLPLVPGQKAWATQ